jgi:hypothetical protein
MKENASKWLVALVIAMIAGPVLGFTLNAYMPALIDTYGMTPVRWGHLSFSVKILSILPYAVICSLWIGSVCKKERIGMGWWVVFGLFFHVVALAVFFSYLAFQRVKVIESDTSSRAPETDH